MGDTNLSGMSFSPSPHRYPSCTDRSWFRALAGVEIFRERMRADIQDYRHCPTRLPKRRTFDFDTSIRLRILCKRLFLGEFNRSSPEVISSWRALSKEIGQI